MYELYWVYEEQNIPNGAFDLLNTETDESFDIFITTDDINLFDCAVMIESDRKFVELYSPSTKLTLLGTYAERPSAEFIKHEFEEYFI